jgi:hypothetical protein
MATTAQMTTEQRTTPMARMVVAQRACRRAAMAAPRLPIPLASMDERPLLRANEIVQRANGVRRESLARPVRISKHARRCEPFADKEAAPG